MSSESTMQASPLLQRIRQTAAKAQKLGTLESIETTSTVLLSTAASPPFVVRVVQNLARKDALTGRQNDPTASKPEHGRDFNPFLPYEKSMHVQDLPPGHVLLLNKFNVVRDHVLVVTAGFEEQSSLLNAADFRAMWGVLGEVDGVAFYNAGRIAGASQRHKHLQVVCGPVCEVAGMGLVPFDAAVAEAAEGAEEGGPFRVGGLGYLHAAVGMRDVVEEAGRGGVAAAGEESMRRYVRLLRGVQEDGRVGVDGEGADRQPFAYNLVATRRWMFVVPRREECFMGVSVNALGFAGCLLVRNVEQLAVVREMGGLAVLRHTGFADE